MRIGPKSQEILYVSHQAPAGPRLFYEKPAILRRLRRHLLPKEGGSGTSSCSTEDTKGIPVTLGSFLRKELGEALRIGPKDSGVTA